jgi:integrase
LLDYKPLGNARLDKIDEDMIEKFKLWALGKELSRTTVNRFLATLKKTLRYAARKKRLIDRVPTIELYPNERGWEYVFSDSDFEHWLEVAPEPLRSASVLTHDAGICRGELLALERDCVILRDTPLGGFWGSIEIRRGLKRDARRRTLPITQAMAVVLHRLLAESQCSHVFSALEDRTRPFSRNTIAAQQQQQMKKLAGEFNADAGLHALRHTFLTEAGRYSQNVRALQLIAGHANIATTMKYIHPSAADVLGIAAQVQAAREARQVPTEVPTAVN